MKKGIVHSIPFFISDDDIYNRRRHKCQNLTTYIQIQPLMPVVVHHMGFMMKIILFKQIVSQLPSGPPDG